MRQSASGGGPSGNMPQNQINNNNAAANDQDEEVYETIGA